MYDSTKDTLDHIAKVRGNIFQMMMNMFMRFERHDASKLEEPEKPMYDEYTPLLRDLTYGSEEYKAILVKMGEALKHHYEHNFHHPEHWEEVDSPDAKVLIEYLDNNDVPGRVDNIIRQYAASLNSRINHMSLLDVMEMLADWKAASMRHKDGHMADSLEINHVRFALSEQLTNIFENTIEEMNWWYVPQ